MKEIIADCCWQGRVPLRPDPICARLYRALEFGHSGLVTPKGCQRVAGGRQGLWGGDFRVTVRQISRTPEGCQRLGDLTAATT